MFKHTADDQLPVIHPERKQVITDSVPQAKEKPSTPVKKIAKQISVQLVNTTVYDNRYLAYEVGNISNVRLVDKAHLIFGVKPQMIDEDIFNASDEPYDWSEELDAAIPTRDHVRLAVYRNGLIRKEDVQDPALLQMSLYGAFPTRFKLGDNQ